MCDEMKPFSYTNSKGVTYYLNKKDVTLRDGKRQTIYYFSKDQRAEAVYELPKGFEVMENPRNGFLTVKRTNEGSCDTGNKGWPCCEDCEADEKPAFDRSPVVEDLLKKLKEYENKHPQPVTHRRTIVEEIQTTCESDNVGESNSVWVQYSYSDEGLSPDKIKEGEKPKAVQVSGTYEINRFSGQRYNKLELEAYIENLKTILRRM